MGRSHEKTEFAGISTVPPGCYATARAGEVRIYPYWDWEIPTPPTRNQNDPMLEFYRDTFASQAARDQPIYDIKKVSMALDQLLECPVDQRIAVAGGLQPVGSVVVMQELFSMHEPRQFRQTVDGGVPADVPAWSGL